MSLHSYPAGGSRTHVYTSVSSDPPRASPDPDPTSSLTLTLPTLRSRVWVRRLLLLLSCGSLLQTKLEVTSLCASVPSALVRRAPGCLMRPLPAAQSLHWALLVVLPCLQPLLLTISPYNLPTTSRAPLKRSRLFQSP